MKKLGFQFFFDRVFNFEQYVYNVVFVLFFNWRQFHFYNNNWIITGGGRGSGSTHGEGMGQVGRYWGDIGD